MKRNKLVIIKNWERALLPGYEHYYPDKRGQPILMKRYSETRK